MEISQINHYKSLKDYGDQNGIDRRTAKKKVEDGSLLLFLFREKKVFIEFAELQKFLVLKLSKGL